MPGRVTGIQAADELAARLHHRMSGPPVAGIRPGTAEGSAANVANAVRVYRSPGHPLASIAAFVRFRSISPVNARRTLGTMRENPRDQSPSGL